MSATPTYDSVVEELRIDPARIAARPAWSFQAAERRCRDQGTRPSRTTAEPSVQQPPTRKTLSRQPAVQGQPTRTVAAAT